MSTKTPSILSTVITVILLLIFGAAVMFFLLVALNGFSERAATPALLTSLVCQGAGILLAGVLTWRLPKIFMEKFNWNKAIAVVVSIPTGLTLGGLIGSAALFIGIIVAEAMR